MSIELVKKATAKDKERGYMQTVNAAGVPIFVCTFRPNKVTADEQDMINWINSSIGQGYKTAFKVLGVDPKPADKDGENPPKK